MQVITTKGVDAVSGRKICEELGLNISLIHYHFGNKDALIREVLQRLTEETLTFTDILYDENISIDKRFYDFFFRMRVFQTISAIAYPAELGVFENLTDDKRAE